MAVTARDTEKPMPLWKAFLPFSLGSCFSFCVCGMFVLVGLFLMVRAVIVEHQVKSWKHATAIVTEEPFTKSSGGRGGANEVPSVSVYVPYRFTVDGKEYEGRRVTALPETFSQKKAKRLIEECEVGSQIEISYDPEDPTTSAIYPLMELQGHKIFPFFLWVPLFTAYAVFVFVRIVRAGPRRQLVMPPGRGQSRSQSRGQSGAPSKRQRKRVSTSRGRRRR